jgi:alkyldihydroxyacetonephosphate synthase
MVQLDQRVAKAFDDIRCSSSAPDRVCYARDLWPRHHIAVRAGRIAEHAPGAVAWPEDSEQLARLIRWCSDEGIGVVPYGAGSGVCGGVLPSPDTLVVDLKRLQRVRTLDRERNLLEVESGALGIRIEEDMERAGFTIGHFPSSILCSTVGGWVAARGAGQCSGRYGKIEDMVASIECIDGRGERVTLQRRNAGPDLTPLWIGSEGILGFITAATLRLHPKSEARVYGAFSFPTMEQGWEAIRAIYQEGLRPAVCRLYDPLDSMMARRKLAKGARKTSGASARSRSAAGLRNLGLGNMALRNLLRVPGALNAAIETLGNRAFGDCTLVVVFEGPHGESLEQMRRTRDVARRGDGRDLGEEPARHWYRHRYSVSYRQAPMFMMGAFVDTMEVAAPWSRFSDLYSSVKKALGRDVLVMAHMSHAYPDGCSIYFTFAASESDDRAAEERYDRAWRRAMDAAIEAGGTLSHHHGVGRSKAPRMGDELGLGVELVGAIRDAVDPHGIFNRGALLPERPPPRQPLPPSPTAPRLEPTSQLVHAAGGHRLDDVARVLEGAGLSLGLDPSTAPAGDTTVDAWLGSGAPGAPDPWLDPVDHLVAGYSAELGSGAALHIRPCPRRAVGPDLYALFHGTGSRVGRLHTVSLRARGAEATPLDCRLERQPAVDDGEQRWIDRVLDAAAAV